MCSPAVRFRFVVVCCVAFGCIRRVVFVVSLFCCVFVVCCVLFVCMVRFVVLLVCMPLRVCCVFCCF